MNLVSLLYHDVLSRDGDDSGFQGASAASYKLSESNFRRHLDAIRGVDGSSPVVLRSRADAAVVQSGWAITFDDAGSSALRPTADLLEERQWFGHFFAATDYIGREGFLTPGQLRELADRGHVVGSHSVSHPLRMAALSPAKLLEEWAVSRDRLSQWLGSDVRVGSIPGGLYSTAVAEAASEAGIELLFTSEPRTDSWRVRSTHLLGRMSVKRETPSDEVARLVSQAPILLARRRVSWGLRRIARTVGGDLYLSAREALFRRSGAS